MSIKYKNSVIYYKQRGVLFSLAHLSGKVVGEEGRQMPLVSIRRHISYKGGEYYEI